MSAHTSYAELWGVAVGEELPAITQTITQEFIDRYAAASLDFNPVHIDPDWSARAKVFGRPATVLHGMAQMSLLCSLVLRAWGAATEITRIEGKFTKPVSSARRSSSRGSSPRCTRSARAATTWWLPRRRATPR